MTSETGADPETPTQRRTGAVVTGIIGELLITFGLLVLLFVGWQVWWVTRAASQASATVVSDLGREFADPALTGTSSTPGPAPATASALTNAGTPTGKAFGLITVPRLGNGPQPVLQGTSTAQLDKGIGHDPTSAMPGQIGNFATAGHRDTYSHPYNRIDALREGDSIVVEVKDGWSVYRVDNSKIVLPHQVEVFAPVPDRVGATPTESWMTLIACEPHWTAQKRWVVHAKLQHWVPRSPATPDAAASPVVRAALAAPTDHPTGH
ncbi:class E sortase [Austwickia chelonae]|uniref:Putative peptidase n=1 Tax=Austwickia chelonae NBRC 105200 TaxID=1184607 RepID=K6VA37_9MICO|nr:class E sortase [Austwickia chelonae]GAB79088.1 putative peptidase [Austwickia chelonae NBRC 105200]